jgi:hypothetical protein
VLALGQDGGNGRGSLELRLGPNRHPQRGQHGPASWPQPLSRY